MTEARRDETRLPPDREAILGSGEALAAEFGVERLFDILRRSEPLEAAR